MRNANSRFALAPSVNIPRTRMNRPFNNSLTFDCGELVPFYYSEVVPGSTHKVNTHKVVRTQPLVSAPFQDIFLDTYYFYIPFRLVWSHWKNFMGENTSSPWVPETTYNIPQLKVRPNGPSGIGNMNRLKGTLWDYFGMPVFDGAPKGDISMSALYTRAYALVVREFFQSEAVETPINVPLDDSDQIILSDNTSIDDEQRIAYGHKPYIVNKFHDYFTSALPSPTKGSTDVLAFPKTPVLPSDEQISFDQMKSLNPNYYPMTGTSINNGTYARPVYSLVNPTPNSVGTTPSFNIPGTNGAYIPTNLWTAFDVTIDQLRNAFAVQRLLERDALGGTRYREVLKAHFGVTSPDASMQVPQYLGGSRKLLNISQVVQTSETGETPLGNVAGMSLTNDSHYEFEQSFTEHGIILGLMCARYRHRYSQGIRRCLSRKTRYDFYFPEFAFLGSQAIKKKEIFANGSSSDEQIFGFAESWSDYKFNPDMVVNEFRPNLNIGLKSWSFADNYNTHPTLSREWLKEDKTNLDRALAVTSSVANQFFANIQVDETVTLPMPLYSYPSIMAQF